MNCIHYKTSDDPREQDPSKLGGNQRMTTSQAILSGDNRASNFALNEEQQAVLDQADRFARKELYPLSARMDREEWWPDEAFRVIGDNGFFGATIPEEYGGAGLDLLAAGLVLQGFARWNHAMALSWVAHDNLCANNIYRNGNEQQRRKYLPDHCAARWGLLRPQRRQDLHHQWTCRRRHLGLRQDRSFKRPAGHFRLHRRKGLSRIQGRTETDQNGLSRRPDRRARVRRLPGTRREPHWWRRSRCVNRDERARS